jgi:hypothetical protein
MAAVANNKYSEDSFELVPPDFRLLCLNFEGRQEADDGDRLRLTPDCELVYWYSAFRCSPRLRLLPRPQRSYVQKGREWEGPTQTKRRPLVVGNSYGSNYTDRSKQKK